jgi:hypothetical protein
VKNLCFFVFALLALLAGCTPPAPALGISPNGDVVAVGGSVTLTATLFNTSLQSEIAWTSTGGVLSAATGSSVSFSSDQEGSYRVSAVAITDPTLTRTVTITVGEEVAVRTSELPTITTILAAGSSKTFVVKASDLTKSALYAELVSANALSVTLYAQTGERLAFSNTPGYFSNNAPSNLLEAQRITTARVCRGPCVITRARNQGYVITIRNDNAVAASYELFIYNESFSDTLEGSENCDPTFNTFTSNLFTPAIEVIPPEPIVRAIETVSDEDCFYSEAKAGKVFLETFSDTAIAVKVDVYQVRGSVNTRFVGSLSAGPGRDEDRLEFSFDYPVLIVAKSGDGRAAPSAGSRYAVNYY